MKTQPRQWVSRLAPILAVALMALPASGAGPKDIVLPKRPAAAQADLVKALENRKSVRDYRQDRLVMEDLSAVLWAANGVNRDYGRRTAPSAFGGAGRTIRTGFSGIRPPRSLTNRRKSLSLYRIFEAISRRLST